MSQQNYSPVNVYSGLPPTTDILAGQATADNATLITIPANRAWLGTVSVSASAQGTQGGGAATAATFVSPGGTTVTPSTSTRIAGIRIDLPTQSTSTSATPTAATASNTMPNVLVVAGTASATLSAVANGAANFVVMAYGVLL